PWRTPKSALFFGTGSVLVAVGGLYGIGIRATAGRWPGGAVLLVGMGALTVLLGLVAGRLRFGQVAVLALFAVVPIQFALFYLDRVLQLAPGSLVVNNAGDGPTDTIIDGLVAERRLAKSAVITEPNGTQTYLVLRRLE